MKVKVRTADFRLSLPVPVGMAGFVLRLIPDSLFERLRAEVPEPYGVLVTKRAVLLIVEECLDVLRENKGLEAVHVECEDGTFVSITL